MRSLMEAEGQGVARGVEFRGAGWSTTDQGGARGTPVEPVDRWATVKMRELGAMVEPTGRGGVWGLQAGGEAKRFPSHGDNGGWQTHGAHTV